MSPAKSKKKNKTKPKISYKPFFLHYFYCLGIISLLLISGFNLNTYLASQKVLGTKIDLSPFINERAYWQNIINKNPSYIDGYLELAKVDVEMGNKDEALIYITQALQLDPNSMKIPQIQKLLGL